MTSGLLKIEQDKLARLQDAIQRLFQENGFFGRLMCSAVQARGHRWLRFESLGTGRRPVWFPASMCRAPDHEFWQVLQVSVDNT